jgi:tetratricopeptide (TPR) repeat protein
MTLDEAIQQITELLKKRRMRKTFFLIAGVLLLLCLGNFVLWLVSIDCIDRGDPFYQVILTVLFLGFFWWGIPIYITRTAIKNWISCDQNTIKNLSNTSWHRGTLLFDYGFYEPALDDFDKILNDMYKNFEKRDEIFSRFLEDIYKTQPRFVNGILRPIPYILYSDLYSLQVAIEWRQRCLLKLGREKEAKAENEKLQTIKIFEEENEQFTKKYSKELGYGELGYD